MNWIKGGVALLAVLAVSGEVLEAQGRSRRGPMSDRPLLGAEQILRAREQLNLTDAQVSELEAIRRETVEARRAEMGTMMELRSRAEAGDSAARAELRAQAAERREASAARREAYRNRINGVLTDEQREQLPAVGRAMARQRGMARGGRGFRGPGQRGFGPQRGFRGRGPNWNRRWRGPGPRRDFRRPWRRPDDAGPDVN